MQADHVFITFFLILIANSDTKLQESSFNLDSSKSGVDSKQTPADKSDKDGTPQCTNQTSPALFPCYCDNLCHLYDDCCENPYKASTENTTRLFSCRSTKELEIGFKSDGSNNGYGSNDHALVFDRCPPGANDDLIRDCESPLTAADGLMRKIVVVSEDLRLFRNVYCALCHNASFLEPNFQLKCKKPQGFTNLSFEDASKMELNSGCVFQTSINDGFRKCVSNATARCRTGPSGHNCLESDTQRRRFFRCSDKVTKSSTGHQNCRQCLLDTNVCDADRGDKEGGIIGFHSFSILTNFRRLLAQKHATAGVPYLNRTNSSNENQTDIKARVPVIASAAHRTTMILSILGLFLLIVVFSAVPALRNFGGILTVSLASSLLVGMLCFVIVNYLTENSTACHVIAAVLYFAFLSYFFWMSLFAMDVLRAFARSAAASGGIKKRYAKFAAGGWLFPLLVTVAAVMVDQLWPQSAVSPRFGQQQCYFNNGDALMVWLFVPASICTVANVGMTISGVFIVWRTMTLARSARDVSRLQLVCLTTKLTVLFGVTWLFGLVAALVDNAMFSEISALINSSQGMFLAGVFLLNERVHRAVKIVLKGGDSKEDTTQKYASKLEK